MGSRLLSVYPIHFTQMKYRIVLVVLLLLAAVLPVHAERTEAEARAELEAVRKQIKALQQERRRTGQKLGGLEKELKASEQKEAEARKALRKVRADLKKTQSRQQQLKADERRQRTALTNMQAELALQMRMAYMQGQEQWLKLVLSQEDAAGLGRRLAWYEYITKQRSELIGDVQEQLESLKLIAAELKQEARTLEKLEANAAESVAKVEAARKDRQAAIKKLKGDLSGKEQQLATLNKQAKELDKLVEQLALILPEMPAVPAGPITAQKGKLKWPVKGKVRKNYGEKRGGGQMRWDGVLIAAPAGNNVRAFYHGRVVYADWLQGMGLLIIVEHGDGYLSLYGHNQELLHGVGSWVQPGEIIARVGDSGGQSEPAVYFELRRNGSPVNPRPWVKK